MKNIFTLVVLVSSLCFSSFSYSAALEKDTAASHAKIATPFTKERLYKTIELVNRLDAEKKQQWISKYKEKRDSARNARERWYYTAILNAVASDQ